MNLDGFKSIIKAFGEAEIEATVAPKPLKNEEIRFVTIQSGSDVPPANVLNALSKAGLMYFVGERDAFSDGPDFVSLGVQPGSITLEDKNVAL
ncbi:hypothetical protein KA068_01665 [Candidatus Saccharibacteria bacterium]|jgi:hypothetical protein|nr:hypothetical protein [Candidatus Saccharibacteria bacterium]